MTRDDILKNAGYHVAKIQLSLCNMIDREKSINRSTNLQIAKKLNISPSKLKSIMDGDFNGKISQLVEIALKLGYTPEVKFHHPIFTNT